MVTPDGKVLLTDFGIAKALGGGDDPTSDNVMMGTAKYSRRSRCGQPPGRARRPLLARARALRVPRPARCRSRARPTPTPHWPRLQRDPDRSDAPAADAARRAGGRDHQLVQRGTGQPLHDRGRGAAALSKALATPEPSIDMPGTPAQSPTPVATPPPATKVARDRSAAIAPRSSSHYPRARDRTPPSPRRRPPPPKMQQRWKPSLVVVGSCWCWRS